MASPRVKAVCGTCKWRSSCPDAGTLEQLRDFLENSRLAAEFDLLEARCYRLGCDRYVLDRRRSARRASPSQLVVGNDNGLPCA